MSANRNRRLVKEIADVQKDTLAGITLESLSDSKDSGSSSTFDNLTHFRGIFLGPPDTPYEGGRYVVDIKIPAEYPFQPPVMRFETRIWHPNVSSQTGAICLDTLGKGWSPIFTLKSALISLQSLLASPEPKDPQDAEVANMMITDPVAFAGKAKTWAQQYANAPVEGATTSRSEGVKAEPKEETAEVKKRKRKEMDEAYARQAYQGYPRTMVDPFCELGFSVENVVAVFKRVGIDTNAGIHRSLDGFETDEVTAALFGET